MRSICKMSLAGLLALGLAVLSPNAKAQGSATFKGKVTSVDKAAQTLTVNGLEYQILPSSKISRSEQPATVHDLAIGEEVNGIYKKSAENKMEVITLDVAPRSGSALGGTGDSSTAQSGASFNGRVTKVDATGKTISIGGQTYQVLATTKIMRDNKPASLNEIKAGQQVVGVYKTSAENKMEVLTLDVGSSKPVVGGTRDSTTTETGASFSGRVAKVDPVTQTMTIAGRTYQILPTTTISTADGTAATLASVHANETVTGTYKKNTEGKFEILTLNVGKK